ncbi:WHG domain-containing protein [Sinomonas sp. JGH33]|uniref:WHG domain-containing protein n=1 Tax=Sinomonas terricola TaxID=3110330 RepID=A0ABU5T235_9MICC|nr:hypothetical protein [Sinomonas sp. JGH33]MEA5453706.1 WHG domain-containing protein [Sinomonas sp. JGH33]
MSRTRLSGYPAPAGPRITPGARIVARLLDILEAARVAGHRTDTKSHLPGKAVAIEIFVWTAILGAVSSEVFGRGVGATSAGPKQLFLGHLEMLADLLGL